MPAVAGVDVDPARAMGTSAESTTVDEWLLCTMMMMMECRMIGCRMGWSEGRDGRTTSTFFENIIYVESRGEGKKKTSNLNRHFIACSFMRRWESGAECHMSGIELLWSHGVRRYGRQPVPEYGHI